MYFIIIPSPHILIGTRRQQGIAVRKQKMQKQLQLKHQTYHRRVKEYNERFKPVPLLPDPSYDDVYSMKITDPFWDGGNLSHPDEAWANETETKEGIQAFLTCRSSREELSRIGREVRHIIQWAIKHQHKLDAIRDQTGRCLTVYIG